jgi:hypothetical protein
MNLADCVVLPEKSCCVSCKLASPFLQSDKHLANQSRQSRNLKCFGIDYNYDRDKKYSCFNI